MARLAPEEEPVAELAERLSVISRVLALNLIRDISSREEQVELLDVAGFSQREIANLLGISYGTVGFILHKIRQTHARKRSKLARENK